MFIIFKLLEKFFLSYFFKKNNFSAKVLHVFSDGVIVRFYAEWTRGELIYFLKVFRSRDQTTCITYRIEKLKLYVLFEGNSYSKKTEFKLEY